MNIKEEIKQEKYLTIKDMKDFVKMLNESGIIDKFITSSYSAKKVFLMRWEGESFANIAKETYLSVHRCRFLYGRAVRQLHKNSVIAFRKHIEQDVFENKIKNLEEEISSLRNVINRYEIKNNINFETGDALIINCEDMLSVRTYNCLKTYEIKTVSELCTYSYDEILKFNGLGKKCIAEIEEFLIRFNRKLSK